MARQSRVQFIDVEKTAKMLREQDAYDRLKAVDMWPFGDLGAEPRLSVLLYLG